MEEMTKIFFVKGHVQGVGFRYFVYRNAVELGLNGYAKNKPDGSVEVVARGSETSLSKLFEKLKVGPSRSYVSECYFELFDTQKEFSGFSIY